MPGPRPRSHDHDAGGPAVLLAAKADLRREIWAALRAAGATRFPRPEGRIPNFVGAEAAAERLRSTDAWQAAATLRGQPRLAAVAGQPAGPGGRQAAVDDYVDTSLLARRT